MAETVGIGVLADDTGEKVRTLQHWSDLGILQPLEATHKMGRGYHREFPADLPYGERTWALIASALGRLRLPLGDMKTLVGTFRTVARGDALAKRITPYQRALAGHPVVLLIGRDPDGSWSWQEYDLEEIRDQRSIQARMESSVWAAPPWGFANAFSEGFFINLTAVLEPLRSSG